jgi:hypothetical protein
MIVLPELAARPAAGEVVADGARHAELRQRRAPLYSNRRSLEVRDRD